jgi:TfoX/Sxy family transcriptional regulator of competence genes
MAYDESLADRVRAALAGTPGLREKRMFGGLCFLVRGNMACGIVRDTLMVRVGPDGYAAALAEPHAREMDFTGRPLRGMVYVDAAGVRTDADLAAWVGRGTAFAGALPPKTLTTLP